MKLLLDNNLSYKLIDHLKTESIEAVHIKMALSVFSMDQEIWEYAFDNDLVILTKDKGFDEMSQ